VPKMKTKRVLSENWRQPPPFALQVELVEGCSLRCGFCGLNGIREPLGSGHNLLKFMEERTVDVLINRLKDEHWLPRIEFAMHGEPSLHPGLTPMLGMFRGSLPDRAHLMMTSNGSGFMKDPTRTIDDALKSLNVLALDWYENVSIVPRIIEYYGGAHRILYYPQDLNANPHRRRQAGEHDLVIVQDIEVASRGTHSTLNNHCGCGAPTNADAQGKRCAKPFREMSVRWDGSVAVCCNDWRGVLPIGNVHDSTLEEIWNHEVMRAARRHLYHGLRTFAPCQGCDALSYRPGLLPDQKGRVALPLPTLDDRRTIGKALGHGPLTLPVLRPWEVAPGVVSPVG
jgi:radical SAM protein with 4Fe4S-binding SPASM domain